ncbi:DUF6517 family protein [Natronocalculus amylovorans]|uniref:DUF6517 family protein n=1 Tax=Natronocalculus amylovorans TaxID=2917812 RepID=A0AAE3FWL5_9EURY|nr:DUF6517 family protein [Natronocalculus amylovorans]MCL9816510.1 DUF6517 family protein [Natronocalculus amylovorans]
MDRRTFVSAAGGLGLLSTSGCIASATPRPPQILDELLEGGWELIEQEQDEVVNHSVAGQEIVATATTEVYHEAELAAALREKTLAQIDGQIAIFFASRVTIEPDLTNLPAGVGRDRILDEVETNAKQQFESELESAGIVDIEEAGEETVTVDTGEEASLQHYHGLFPFDSFSFAIREDNEVTIESDSLSVSGHLAVWHHDDSVLIAGGAYPSENFEETIDEELSSAISVTVEIDLGLDPTQYEDDLFELIRAVE